MLLILTLNCFLSTRPDLIRTQNERRIIAKHLKTYLRRITKQKFSFPDSGSEEYDNESIKSLPEAEKQLAFPESPQNRTWERSTLATSSITYTDSSRSSPGSGSEFQPPSDILLAESQFDFSMTSDTLENHSSLPSTSNTNANPTSLSKISLQDGLPKNPQSLMMGNERYFQLVVLVTEEQLFAARELYRPSDQNHGMEKKKHFSRNRRRRFSKNEDDLLL